MTIFMSQTAALTNSLTCLLPHKSSRLLFNSSSAIKGTGKLMTPTGDGAHRCTRFFFDTFCLRRKMTWSKDKRRKTESRSIFVSWQLSTIDNYLCKYLPMLNIYVQRKRLNSHHEVEVHATATFLWKNFLIINDFLCMKMTWKRVKLSRCNPASRHFASFEVVMHFYDKIIIKILLTKCHHVRAPQRLFHGRFR